MKKIILFLILFTVISTNRVSAQETVSGAVAPELKAEEATEEEAYIFPVIKPQISISAGYGFVGLSGSERAGEFKYLHNSISLGSELRVFSFPHRFHLDMDVENRKDYFGDISYAYEDLVLFRGINRTLFHNLENIRLTGVTVPSYGVDVRDRDKKYGVKVGMSSIFLRFKTHDFPFHVYIDGSLREREGIQQQRSLMGSGSFNNMIRTSQSRDIDWKTKNLNLGANSHLGPVEVDISHCEKRFDAGGDKVLFDNYASSAYRAAGQYPHNLVPDLKGSSDTLKLHTSFTGSLVASATLSRTDRENKDSRAKADYFTGAGELTWIESPRLVFFLRYRHREADIDNPDSVTLTDRTNPANAYTYKVERSISSITDGVSGIMRYRPLSGLTLKAEYSYEDIRRKVAAEWGIPGSTQKNIALLSADIRLVKGVNVKARYTHKYNIDPAYNIEPENSDEGSISFSWVPRPGLNALFSYSALKEKRDNLHFTDTDAAENRDTKKNRLLGSVTFLALKDLSLTAGYSYLQNKTEQDIEYHDLTGGAHIDPLVPYKDTSHNYFFDMNYIPRNNISLNAGVAHTLSSGAFHPSDINLVQPVSVASLSELKTRETVYTIAWEYRFKGGFASGIQYRYSNFNDVLDNPYDDLDDGKAQLVLLTFSKKW